MQICNNCMFHCLCYFKTPTMAWPPLARQCRCKISVCPTRLQYKVLGHAGGKKQGRCAEASGAMQYIPCRGKSGKKGRQEWSGMLLNLLGTSIFFLLKIWQWFPDLCQASFKSLQAICPHGFPMAKNFHVCVLHSWQIIGLEAVAQK